MAIPERMRAHLFMPTRQYVIAPHAHGGGSYPDQPGAEEITEEDLDPAHMDRFRGAVLHIFMTPKHCVFDHFTVPKGIPEAKLDRLVFHELQRRSPSSPADIYFGFRLIKSEYGQSEKVILCITQKEYVAGLLDRIRGCGFGEFYIEAPMPDPGYGTIVLYKLQAAMPSLLPQRTSLIKWVAAVVLALIGMTSAFNMRSTYIVSELQRQKGRMEQLSVSENADETLLRHWADIAKEIKQSAISDILLDLSLSLPMDSWVEVFDYREGVINIVGYSRDPTEMLLQLKKSGKFNDVVFSGPLTPAPVEQRTGVKLQRFQIVARLFSGAAQP